MKPASLRNSKPSGPRAVSWKGTSRYEVVRVIGEGGMGVVYEALDRERRERVALKTLLNFNPDALYRFKNEFRTLADVHHPSLVRLHEFVMTDSDHVFFTMELVVGADFRRYATRADVGVASPARPRTLTAPPTAPPTQRGVVSGAPEAAPEPASVSLFRGPSPADIGRLRPALLSLVEGIQALHDAGKLHRDVKPSNVLVSPHGRVVLLDFGVATQLSRGGDEVDDSEVVGTARYMAPEQAADEPPTTASDWYSVGVMLYEVLVGRPPFVGSTIEVLARKNLTEPPPPSACVTDVPDDLDVLCASLLRSRAAMRPTGPEILARLRPAGPGDSVPRIQVAPKDAVFVGREAQLAQLRDAFEAARAGRSITVRVVGASGMGKSTLVEHFCQDLSQAGRAVVLRGRAYERESVPYKAVDSAIDALSRHLMRLAETDPALALPPDFWALARLFPVLRRVPNVAPAAEDAVDDPHHVRRRALGALRDVLRTLGRNNPVVLYIDDVQWGDTDSAALLVELMRPPDPGPLLLVMTYRDTEAAASPFLIETDACWAPGAEVMTVEVGPLAPPDGRRLALALLQMKSELAEQAAGVAVRESGGSPFIIEELVRSNLVVTPGDKMALQVLTLEQMVGVRFEHLTSDARRLVEIVAVGGRPLPVSVIADAASIYTGVDDVIGQARAQGFVRTGMRGGHEVLEMSHDRIREAVVARLPAPKLRNSHGRLGRVLEATPGADAEAVALHLLGGGDTDRGARFAERAAEQAAEKLAFDQAATLFRRTLEHVAPSSADARRLRTRLAQVLELGGRGAEAARVYLEAANGTKGIQRIELERAAAEQLLTSGQIDEGSAMLHRVLAASGMRAPGSARRAVFALLFYRLWLLWMRWTLEDRDPEDVRREDRVRVDTLYAVAIGFAVIDIVLGRCMQARHMVLALRLGDRIQVLRAASIESSQFANRGGPVGKRERALLENIRSLLARTDASEAHAFFEGNRGVSAFLRGRWQEAVNLLDAAFEKYPNNRGGWHSNANLFAVYALSYMGRLNESRVRQARLLDEALRRGDLYTTVNLRTAMIKTVLLAADDPEGARREVNDAIGTWSHEGYLLQHWQAMRSTADIEIYVGEGGRAYERVMRDARALKKGFLLRTQFVRAMTADLRGRCAIASLVAEPAAREVRLAEARRMVRQLGHEGMPYAVALGSLLAAAAANASGDSEAAAAGVREAIRLLEAADMPLYAASGRCKLGLLVGGEAGRQLVREGEEVMKAQGIRDCQRFATVYVPGRWGEGRA
jgi:tetratricopeptide (TPR) repeat protein